MMATAPKRLHARTWAADRQLIELAQTKTLEAIVKKLAANLRPFSRQPSGWGLRSRERRGLEAHGGKAQAWLERQEWAKRR
jgi:hypothetical protein